MPVYRRTLIYYRPFLARTVWGIALSFVGVGLNLLKPWPFAYIVDDVLTPAAERQAAQPWVAALLESTSPALFIALMCGALVVISLLWGAVNFCTNMIFVRAGLEALLKLRTDLYAYLQSLPLKFHDERRSTDSSFRVAYDSQAIQTIYNKGFTNIFMSAVTLLSILGVMLWKDWSLTLVAMAVIPFLILAIRLFAVRVRHESTLIQERESAVLTIAQEGLSSVRMVHAFGREEHEVAQFRRHAVESLSANLKLTLTTISSALVVGTLITLGTALLYYVGSLHVLDGTIQLGDLLVFTSYLVMLYTPLEALTYTAWALEGAAAGAQRCFEILDREDEVSDRPEARPLGPTKGAIRFEKVAFSYDGSRPILSDIDVEVVPGQRVAFVGGTGAGKSTLLSLVPRFYDPTAGRVTLDGHDLRDLTKKSVREQISVVLQDTVLFSTTIRENIAYGRPDATDEEIIEAARRAQAHDFISALADGYRAQVGERGSHLSVGQRQRIGIARAFLKNAPILLLDEPTSALDATTEKAIMQTIQSLMEGRTTLIITHRITTVRNMDKIVVLRDGRIAEQGTEPELLAMNGTYADLFRATHDQP